MYVATTELLIFEVNEDEGVDEVATCKRGPVKTASEC